MTTEQSQTRGKLSRADWLKAALKVLVQEGAGAIHVEPLAVTLGVTKGSFYWHFKDLQELLSSVIDYWATRMIDAVNDHERLTGTASDQLLTVMEDIAREQRGRYEAAMRTWAASDERAARAVRRVDEARLEWTHSLFIEMGFAPDQAEIRSRMMVFYEYGEAEFSIPADLEQRLGWVKLRHEVLTCGGP